VKLDSSNKRILVISDIHQESDKANKIIKKEDADEVVILGDFFDSFQKNSESDTEKTCNFLLECFQTEKMFVLWGNHDLHYFHPSRHTICSGYSSIRQTSINTLLYPIKNYLSKKFKWYIQIDDFICTHAGLSSFHFYPNLNLEKISEWLDQEAETATIKLQINDSHWFYGAGKTRRGKLEKGGIVWLDFNYEFEPINGLKQIMGHTFEKIIRPDYSEKSSNPNDWRNICIDCNLNQYLIIDNKKIKVVDFV